MACGTAGEYYSGRRACIHRARWEYHLEYNISISRYYSLHRSAAVDGRLHSLRCPGQLGLRCDAVSAAILGLYVDWLLSLSGTPQGYPQASSRGAVSRAPCQMFGGQAQPLTAQGVAWVLRNSEGE
jgi:hypothetical protein